MPRRRSRLRAGATVRATNALANALNDPVKVKILLEQGDLRPSDPELRDALLYARAPAVVKLLIEHGASLDARDSDGLTPYARAARFKSEETMRLLDAGLPGDARGVDGGTAVHFAGLWGHGSTVELLLARGADQEAWSAPGPRLGTPLSWTAWGSRNRPGAAERLDGYLAAAVALLAAGARVTEGMIEIAADELSLQLEEAGARTGIVRVTATAGV